MTTKEFIESLCSLYPKHPDTIALQHYKRKLKEWRLSDDKNYRLFERLSDSCQYFPTLAEMVTSAKELGLITERQQQGAHWQFFDYRNQRYARRISDPSNPPALASGASNPHVVPFNPAYPSEEQLVSENRNYRHKSDFAPIGEVKQFTPHKPDEVPF